MLRKLRELIEEKSVYDADYGRYIIGVSDIEEVLADVREELPVIPQFVADWLIYCKKLNMNILTSLMEVSNKEREKSNPELRIWFSSAQGSYKDKVELFARAWLDGYTVEKEKLYIIKFAPSVFGTPTYGSIGTQNGKKIMQSVYGSQEGIITPNQYTRREIEEVGSKYMAFAEEVTE